MLGTWIDGNCSVTNIDPQEMRIGVYLYPPTHLKLAHFTEGSPTDVCSKTTHAISECKNLWDNLVSADLGPDLNLVQTTITGSQNPGINTCLNCAQCGNIQKSPHSHIHKQVGGLREMEIFLEIPMVYLLKWPCGLEYVGENRQRPHLKTQIYYLQ